MRRVGLAVLTLRLAVPPCARADTLTVAADAQTSAARPTANFGRAASMAVRHDAGGTIARYVRFALSALPADPRTLVRSSWEPA